MANLIFTIRDDQLTRVLDGVAEDNNYQITIDGSPNPETKTQFCRRMLRERLRDMVLAGERKKAERDALATLDQTELDIT